MVVVDFTTTCGLAIADLLAGNASSPGNAIVMLSATGFVEPLIAAYTGGPVDPATVPSFAMPLRHPMTCLQRINNMIAYLAIRYAADWMIRAPSDRLRCAHSACANNESNSTHRLVTYQAQARHFWGHAVVTAACFQVAHQCVWKLKVFSPYL